MLKLRKVTKIYGNRRVLDDISLDLKDSGMVFILGDSGCGKTTLLQAISGLLEIEGDIFFRNKSLKMIKDIDLFRLKNLGFVYQDFRLLNNETSYDNIALPYKALYDPNKKEEKSKVLDLLKVVDLEKKKDSFIFQLSGGEKQRIAIARALVNDPEIILCDEPTGALDANSSLLVMHILEKISFNKLVIVVTHDIDLANKFADEIIYLDEGKIKKHVYKKKIILDRSPLMMRQSKRNIRKVRLSQLFLFKHCYKLLKIKKLRMLMSVFITSLGLIGVGLASSLSSSISSNIKDSYSRLLGEKRIIIKNKEENKSIDVTSSLTYPEAVTLYKNYPQYISDVGVCYMANFEEFFVDYNKFSLADTIMKEIIPSYSVRNINEFEWLDLIEDKVYPSKPDQLAEDEIVISLDNLMVKDICFALKIPRTINSLSEYLKDKPINVVLETMNKSWRYEDEQLFSIVGFTLKKEPIIYHYDHLWNEKILEKNMRMKSTNELNTNKDAPWYMKKIPFLLIKENMDKFLKEVRYNAKFKNYLFDLSNVNYFPLLYRDKHIDKVNRLMTFIKPNYGLDLSNLKYISDYSSELNNLLIGSPYGYAIYESAMMIGFSNMTYFSSVHKEIDEMIDLNTNANVNFEDIFNLPAHTVSGHYSNSMTTGVSFSPIKNKDLSVDELIISSALKEKFFKDDNALNKNLYIASSNGGYYNEKGEYMSEFTSTKVKVVGVFKDDSYVIYHSKDWLLDFFMLKLGFSGFNLIPNSISYTYEDETTIDNLIEELNQQFPKLNFINPMSELNKSVNDVTFILEIALFVLSFISSIIAIILAFFSGYIYINDSLKEIGSLRCLGINKKESKKFVYSYMLIIGFISYLLSVFELTFINFMTSFEMANIFKTGFNIKIAILPYFYMFVLCLLITLIPSYAASRSFDKLDPISAYKSQI